MKFATPPLRLLGSGQIVSLRNDAITLRSRKQLALLAYLAVEHATAHNRDALMALLWPDESTARAQNNLRVTLSRLRELPAQLVANAAQADLLLTDRHTVQLHPTGSTAPMRTGSSARSRARSTRTQPRPVATCQPLLVQPRGCIGDSAVGLMRHFRGMAGDAAGAAAHAGDRACADLPRTPKPRRLAAPAAAQRQIDLDPLRESAYRQQMRTRRDWTNAAPRWRCLSAVAQS